MFPETAPVCPNHSRSGFRGETASKRLVPALVANALVGSALVQNAFRAK
jgi:hypothetical protein